MCIIAIKPKGVAMPPSSWIENMWYVNADGAGFMYADGRKVHIHKGYMKLDDFNNALLSLGTLEELKEIPLVMHFRIGTAGGNVPANTHPFPITDSIPMMQKLACTTKLGIVHNGIIPITPRQQNISDTMEYIASQLAPLYRYDNEFYRSKDLLQMIGNATVSKFAFMNANGEIFTVGQFIEENGCLFSNASYSSGYWYRRTPVRAYGLSEKDYDDLYDEWNYGVSQGEYITDLMIMSDGAYAVNMDTGDFYDSDEYNLFIDQYGYLYVYDEYLQCCSPVAGDYGIYTKYGMPLKFDKESAGAMIVMDTDVDMEDFIDEMTEREDQPKEEDNENKTDDDQPF